LAFTSISFIHAKEKYEAHHRSSLKASALFLWEQSQKRKMSLAKKSQRGKFSLEGNNQNIMSPNQW